MVDGCQVWDWVQNLERLYPVYDQLDASGPSLAIEVQGAHQINSWPLVLLRVWG